MPSTRSTRSGRGSSRPSQLHSSASSRSRHFQMAGELIELEAIAARRHRLDAIALEDSSIWVLPYEGLVALSREMPALQARLHHR